MKSRSYRKLRFSEGTSSHCAGSLAAPGYHKCSLKVAVIDYLRALDIRSPKARCCVHSGGSEGGSVPFSSTIFWCFPAIFVTHWHEIHHSNSQSSSGFPCILKWILLSERSQSKMTITCTSTTTSHSGKDKIMETV